MKDTILAVLAFVSVLGAQYPPSTNARSLQGRRISSTAPNNIEVLAYLSATGQWTPTGLGAGGLDLITGASTLTTTSVIPRVSAAGVLGPSKLVCTGSPVTCTLYDDTAVTGSTRLVVRAGAADPTTAPLGAELVTNGAFTTDLSGWTVGANWGWNAGTALHTAGSVETLAQNISVTNATTYQVEFKISGRTAGGVTVTIGAVTLICYPWDSSFTENGTWQRTLVASGTGSQALTFTPTLAFDGALDDVTVKAITGPIPSLLEWRNAANAVVIEARGDAALSNSAMGLSALQYNTTGFYNSAQGVRALYSNTTGNDNSAQGVEAGYTETPANANVSGSQNVWIGYQSGPGVVTQLDNSIGVGYRSHPMASNHAVFGNSSITLTTLYGRVEMGTEAKWANGVEGTCDATNRGRVVMVQGGVGVADTYRICSKDAADAYAWRSLQ